MSLEANKLLYDILRAADHIETFCKHKDFIAYEGDAMLRSAVERQLEIIGEALSKLSRVAPETANRISEFRRIIAFRNILIHGYAEIDNRIVWGVVEAKLPLLHQQVKTLFAP
jgi:uncharacterized protein with HEPN domain